MPDADRPSVTSVPATTPWRAFRRTGLSVRLAVLSAVLAALVTAVTFVALSVKVRRSTEQLFANELDRNGRTLVALQRDSRRQLVLTAALLSESPTLKSALATYRVEQRSSPGRRAELTATVQGALEHLGAGLPGDVLLATDEHGQVFAGYARGSVVPMPGTDLAALPAVRNALDPSLNTSVDEFYLAGLETGSGYYRVGVAPLILDGFTIGTIVYGDRVDAALAHALQRNFDGGVVISAGSRIISSTIPPNQAAQVAGASYHSGTPIRLGADDYLAAVIPLGRTQRGTPLRITLLQPLSPAVRPITRSLLSDFALYGLLGVLLAALGAAVLSRSVLRPLSRFIAFMRQGAARERVDQAFDADDASHELRTLNESFNQLMASLGGKREELERRGAELAAANDVLTDEIRERERVQVALRESEAQLRQSQKLEAIGTLAGGIAHDFNNMLTVISGFTQMAQSTLGKQHPVAQDLEYVSEASRSAAALTHQLLAFSRKQVLLPRVIDLAGVVGGMEPMVRRLIGPHIDLEVTHAGTPLIKADPGQVEQVLLNLAVNARDAMPDGGQLRISTEQCAGTGTVVLRVRDTGTGMTAAVRERIFEPFFTTKDVGKGTGLGLSTVYGIVAQSGGTIEVESAPGAGTTFCVTFPAAVDPLPVHDAALEDALPLGSETILLVDDEEGVLDFARRTLEGCGYTVLAARSGVEALAYARGGAAIDLLLTDVLMPQLTGPQLVERYLAKYPHSCVIYMTGNVDDATMRLELDMSVVLLRKPFGASELARMVRATIDARCAALPASHVP